MPAAVQNFFTYLKNADLVLPQQKSKLDGLVADYVDYLWSTGAGRAQACDTLAGLQDLQPDLRHNLPGAWRLLKTWSINEIPARAPPIPDHVVHAMAGWAFFQGLEFFCCLAISRILLHVENRGDLRAPIKPTFFVEARIDKLLSVWG